MAQRWWGVAHLPTPRVMVNRKLARSRGERETLLTSRAQHSGLGLRGAPRTTSERRRGSEEAGKRRSSGGSAGVAGGALGSKQLGRGGGAMTSDSPNMHKTTCEPDDDASMNSIATSHKLMGAKVTD